MRKHVFFDQHGFVSIATDGNPALEEFSYCESGDGGKEYTRSFYGYPYSSLDHTVLLYTKGQIVEKQWKDIGAGQQVIRYRQQYTPFKEQPSWNIVFSGFSILSTRDDETATKILSKVDKKIQMYVETYMEPMKNLFLQKGFSSDTQGSDVSYKPFEGNVSFFLSDEHLVEFLFGVLLAHGSWTVKEGVLYPVKATIPLTSSLFGQRELLESIYKRLYELKLIHSYSFQQSSTYEYCQATFHDAILLKQRQKWIAASGFAGEKGLSIEKNIALEYTQSVYQALKEYACSLESCIDWKYDTLQVLPCD